MSGFPAPQFWDKLRRPEWRIERCWEATRAPSQGRDCGSKPKMDLLSIQQSWLKAINPGGLEAEPPCSSKILFRIPKQPVRWAAVACRAAWALAAAVGQPHIAR